VHWAVLLLCFVRVPFLRCRRLSVSLSLSACPRAPVHPLVSSDIRMFSSKTVRRELDGAWVTEFV